MRWKVFTMERELADVTAERDRLRDTTERLHEKVSVLQCKLDQTVYELNARIAQLGQFNENLHRIVMEAMNTRTIQILLPDKTFDSKIDAALRGEDGQ